MTLSDNLSMDDRLYWEAENQDIVVLPSCTFDTNELRKVHSLHQYEERFLYHILLLARPGTRVIFVTSVPVDPDLVAYYLSLLPPTVEGAENLLGTRLFMISTDDGRNDRCLARKIVEKPRLVEHVRKIVEERSRREPGVLPARLEVYRRTRHEALAAQALGIELVGTEPELLRWGTKSGSRSIFADAGVPHAPGLFEAERNIDRLAERVVEVLVQCAESDERFFVTKENCPDRVTIKGIVKLEDGFGGLGNGLVDLSAAFSLIEDRSRTMNNKLANHNRESAAKLVLEAFCEMEFECQEENWQSFRAAVESTGAVFELFVPKVNGQTTPSAQAYINQHTSTGRGADVIALSTHEQILNGHAYGGCEFPANEAYRTKLEEYVRAVGSSLARRGEVGHFGVDFIATPSPYAESAAPYRLDALEINLRTTGTTCPLMMLKLLESSHDPAAVGLRGVRHGHYIAFDYFGKVDYTVFTPVDLQEILADLSLTCRRRSFRDCSTKSLVPGIGDAEPCSANVLRATGILLYMHGAVAELGTFGIAFVGHTREDCQKLIQEVSRRLDQEAKRCRATLPTTDEGTGDSCSA